MIPRPAITFSNRQRGEVVNPRRVAARLLQAVPAAVDASKAGSVISGLDLIEITLVSDRAIARVHGRFFNDPGPTDVITFDHGEILIGAGTVASNARAFGLTFEDEVVLCGIHGMLHLGGWSDAEDHEAREMTARQEAILQLVMRPG